MEDIILTPEQVVAIRKEANTPGVKYASVAAKYNIDVAHVKYIANREFKKEKDKEDK